MPKNKRKFISKKNSVTFHLVHRSQQDPLTADENAPQHVLMEHGSRSKKDTEEEHKFGIFFDDEYDYLQHLKGSSETEVSWVPVGPKINVKVKEEAKKVGILLPSSVFASEVEEHVGLLNKAAPVHGPRLDLDPDIVAAMDEDFDYDDPDNILEDDFIEMANKERSDEDNSEGYSDIEEGEEDEGDELGSLNNDFEEVETKSRFTNYSMTSSVMRRNEQLSLLDSRFEQAMAGYDADEIGALDCDEIAGTVDDGILLALAEQYEKHTTLEEDNLKDRILAAIGEDAEGEMTERMVVEKDKERWDCESILSTYSNLYNHPAKICEPKGPPKIRVSKKTGVPLDVIGGSAGGPRLTAHALAQLNGDSSSGGPKSVISMVSELSVRPKNETPEERKVRKQNVKEYRRERRIEKKANTMAFKEENVRQKILINLKNNLKGIKIL